ncbi:disulfide oxidoreductase [Pelagibius litoralis]|uniref:Disulfide oxidoreductase n=1 Tax=Pelagibius litoralis TaxID=374515 RepID=A0A967F0X9_9PROT|nr:helicase-related protein [Pelagibius litoralis]NIA71096.1 disulfide oxidoreductase [Pelagibius litoralis]
MSLFAQAQDKAQVTAVLGPTNTGKTYLAIDRMLGHSSGMIGFPLRLLARENYERIVQIKGAAQVALVTGEEKIVPPGARYFCCTVESMPVDRPVSFLAVDEIQLCADPERGHIFTDRLLHARGFAETMFLGAETIRPVLQALVPEAIFVTRPRFSTLSYTGPQKLTRLPPRSAVVAFSASEVYATAELLRRQRGGTAVVLGALSPRTRNAQVAMFEAGEVDYLVATDAIGMGLNLNLDHVAFAKLRKFDGRGQRRLTAPEVGQIAGRAGRHMNDGTFGTTTEIGPLSDSLVEAVENHVFPPLAFVHWRNPDLDFRDPEHLLKSLDRRPPRPEMLLAQQADDQVALAILAKEAEIAALATTPANVALLWEVCQVPDFRKILSDHHAQLLAQIYVRLMTNEGRLPEDWVAAQLARLERSDGDIDQLVARIAHIRTWTYITHRGDWLDDVEHWQDRARAIEDALSDALHERLTQRFVDRRAAVLVRRLRGDGELIGAVRKNGEVVVEGEFVGRFAGFRFELDEEAKGEDARPLLAAARRALVGEIPRRIKQLEQDNDGAFALSGNEITWRGTPVARLQAGDTALTPGIEVLHSDFLDGPARERLRKRCMLWLTRHIQATLKPLIAVQKAELSAPGRGLLFQLVEALGTLPRRPLSAQIALLTKADRKALAALGVRLGAASLFLPRLQQPRMLQLRARLWALRAGCEEPPLPSVGTKLFELTDAASLTRDVEGFCHALGFRLATRRSGAPLAVRADVLERLSREAYRLSAENGSLSLTAELCKLAEATEADMAVLLFALGYRRQQEGEGTVSYSRRGARAKPRQNAAAGVAATAENKPAKRPKKRGRKPSRQSLEDEKRYADSPFAVLRNLALSGK